MASTRAPEPAPHRPRVIWRAPTSDEAAPLADLYAAWADGSGLTWRISAEEIAHEMTAPEADLAADYRVAENADGLLVASVVAHLRSVPGRKHRAWLFITSRPGFEPLESAAAIWGIERATSVFGRSGDDMPRVVRVNADVRNTARISRFEELGFTICRFFVEMVRPLADPIPALALPDGLELVEWGQRWVEPSWEAHCDAFRDHWGSLPPTLEEWGHRGEDPGFRRDLSLLAVDGETVVGYASSAVFPEDWPHRRRREGWIETLGTRREWRGRGIASTLIAEAMRRFAHAGLDHAALEVDSANATGAFHLYERLGFVEVDRTVDLMQELPEAGR